MKELVELLDDAVDGRVLIFGSLPPEARDLDLLAGPAQTESLQQALRDLGFDRRGHTWARFELGSANVVDVVPVSSWNLSSEEESQLFSQAVVLDGCSHLSTPAPHHTLLIAALRVVRSGRLDAKRKERVRRTLAMDPEAWEAAGARAPDWRAGRALPLLKQMYDHDLLSAPPRERFQALSEASPASGIEATARAAKQIAPSRKQGHVIALSGLDGAGKSTQAAALVDSLHQLGFEAAAVWTRLAQDPSLDRIAGPVKAILRRRRRPRSSSGGGVDAAAQVSVDEDQRGPLVTFLWSHLVAVANGRAHRRAVLKELRRGRVVVCDRYVLDSHVHLRRKYPTLRSVRTQVGLIRLLSPKPLRSYLLHIDAEESTRRKQDVYSKEQLQRHAELYLETYQLYGTRLIDGTKDPHEIAASIASDVWAGLKH